MGQKMATNKRVRRRGRRELDDEQQRPPRIGGQQNIKCIVWGGGGNRPIAQALPAWTKTQALDWRGGLLAMERAGPARVELHSLLTAAGCASADTAGVLGDALAVAVVRRWRWGLHAKWNRKQHKQ